MRLNQKRQIMDFIATIEEGIDYASHSNDDRTSVILQDSNDGLQFLLKLMNGEKEVLELLHQAVQAVQSLMAGMKEEHKYLLHINKLKSLMVDVKSLIINNIKTDIEIAFMPYKASMWDALESIYKEANQDPNCTCYVVPIPYYEKNAQGDIIKFCYEGNEFPKDVTTIPFELYDFENRRPDIIYIHNPFDNYNILTMVNNRFFSGNLAQYTEMLVYVPYYLAGSTATPEVSVFPSFMNAAKIIVQSKNSLHAFIANGIDAHKLLDLGSPKLDAMFEAIKEPKEIPYYWKKIIGDKKVFLLNTGIADLLSIDAWFEQVEQVLNFFMDHEQFAVIWRPHPLTEVTIKTMRPQLLESFGILENKLKQAANVIVDNSSDIYPAVAASDGIISDYSSVMLQCIVTEKPILGLLNSQMIGTDRYYHADYSGCYFVNQDFTVPQFVEMVERGEDHKREDRVSRFKNSVSNADGTCGAKIHQSIQNELMQQVLNV